MSTNCKNSDNWNRLKGRPRSAAHTRKRYNQIMDMAKGNYIYIVIDAFSHTVRCNADESIKICSLWDK